MRGTVYGVGIGPGDPELLTLKALRLIRGCDVIAVPGRSAEESTAYRIAVKAVPEIADKDLLPVCMPMAKDKDVLREAHRQGALIIEKILDQGKNVVYLTLGDPSVYSTFSYLQHFFEADGYNVEVIPGIPSFCAAAARLKMPLTEWDEPLHILPALYNTEETLDRDGTCVLMKSASRMKEVKEMIRRSGRETAAVINCGMEDEKVYASLEDIPDDAGYFSLIISRAERQNHSKV